MSAVGLSTALISAWFNTFRNVPFTVPITCMQLHTGVPGADGTSNPSSVIARVAFTFAGATPDGISITGNPPSWTMTGDETLSHISVWSGYESDPNAMFLFSMALKVPKTVAAGDKYTQNSSNLTFLTKAA